MNYRVYVKKKEAFRVEADSLFHELKQNLNLAMKYMVKNFTDSNLA